MRSADSQAREEARYLSITEAARYLGVPDLSVYRLIWAGRLHAKKMPVGRTGRRYRWLVERRSLDEMLAGSGEGERG